MTKEEVLALPSKPCTKCGLEKPQSDFFLRYRNGSFHAHSECKECTKAAKHIWANNNKDYCQEYTRTYYYSNWDLVKTKNRIRRRGLQYEKSPRDSVKEKARKLLQYAVRMGRIIRLPCEVCGSEKSEGHHEDYSKPYDVTWLCKDHHMELHRRYPECELLEAT